MCQIALPYILKLISSLPNDDEDSNDFKTSSGRRFKKF